MMGDSENTDIPTITPIEEIDEIEEMEEEKEERNIVLEQNEIFKTNLEVVPVVPIEPEEKTKELNGWGQEKKRGVGKRGPDKKKRVKKPASEKQLAHLARMRAKATQKRIERATERKQKLEVAKKIAKKVTFVPPPVENLKRAILKKENKILRHESTNHPRQTKEADFFELMDKYESYKKAKNKKISMEKSLQERLLEKRRAKPHPNRKIPTLQRPAAPINPFVDIFNNYKGRL
jgi:hypothetical protein